MAKVPWAGFGGTGGKGKCKHGHFPSSCVECAVGLYAQQGGWVSASGMSINCGVWSPPPPTQPATLETSVTEIIGMRSWFLVSDEDGLPLLRSYHFANVWEGPRLVADKVPTVKNEHGVYAMKGWPTKSHPINSGYFSTVPVTGTVSLSGTVVCGEYGYRGEQAMIRSLRLHGVAWRLNKWAELHANSVDCYAATVEAVSPFPPLSVVGALEARYGCEVTWMGDESAWAPDAPVERTGLKAQGY